MIGFVLESDITKCKEWILRCIDIGKSFNYEEIYPQEYLRALGFMMSFNAHYLNRKLFEEMNMWFGTFANGLIEYDMCEVNYDEFCTLMKFTTDFCYMVSEHGGRDYFLRLRD